MKTEAQVPVPPGLVGGVNAWVGALVGLPEMVQETVYAPPLGELYVDTYASTKKYTNTPDVPLLV